MTKEAYFINYISLCCNLVTYWFLVTLIVNTAKFRSLEAKKKIKQRWMNLRKNSQMFQQVKGWQKPEDIQEPEAASNPQVQFMTTANIILMLSNTFLLLSNIFVLFFHLPFEMAKSSMIDGYVRQFLGVGCCLSWINCVTLMASLRKFRVVGSFSQVARSIENSLKGVARLLYGVAPLFFAFLFGGFCMFHEHEKFDSLMKTNATLQAILSGDEIMNFIIPLKETYGRPGLIYSMAFCILFIICIHNVLIYIIAESFKIHAEIQEKDDRKLRKVSLNPAITPYLKLPMQGDPAMLMKSEDTLVAEEVYIEDQLVGGDDNINKVKTRIFNKIIPQSRDTHILEMTMKKSMIKDDIRYLKQSIQDLAAEKIGKFNLARSYDEISSTPFESTLRGIRVEAVIPPHKNFPR